VIPAADALERSARRQPPVRRGRLQTPHGRHRFRTRRLETAPNQEPSRSILGCADSRVPARSCSIKGSATLFVIRVAGNIVAPSQSAASSSPRTHRRALVVVLGHSALRRHPGHPRGARRGRSNGTVARPSLDRRADAPRHPTDPALADHADRRRADPPRRAGQRDGLGGHLRHGSEILERLIQTDGLVIVGAEYCLETGVVEFFDGI
jgi:carbonic anhydrase